VVDNCQLFLRAVSRADARALTHRLRAPPPLVFRADVHRATQEGVPGEPLPNAAYRFNPPGADRSVFRNVGKPGHQAETRELLTCILIESGWGDLNSRPLVPQTTKPCVWLTPRVTLDW
jgi:hypothetical protein